MNKKGFTLVELLAVIVILALLTLLTSTAVTKLVSDSKEELSNTQINLIKSAAETWGADNLIELPSAGECSYLTLQDLKYYGLLDSNIIDPKNNEEISDDLKIKITTELSSYGKPLTNYEVNSESIEGCSQIYFPICTIAEDSSIQGLNAGAKYNCKVDPDKDPYTFYVLTTPTEGTTRVNLIMDSNINISGEAVKSDDMADKGLVAWYSDSNNVSYGPLTAMNYLKNATSNWKNLNKITISTFIDDEGNIHEMAQTYDIYARMPYYSEVEASNGTNEYLYEYMDLDADHWLGTGPLPTNTVEGVNGYWLLSFNTDYNLALLIFYIGGNHAIDASENNAVGVRPVITVPVNRITQ